MTDALGGEESRAAMKAGGSLIVPRGSSFRVTAAEPANLLGLVCGPGLDRAAVCRQFADVDYACATGVDVSSGSA